MANFIKSHSNYVLKTKHQNINDGTVFERDITTIGAVDQFGVGQTPIYRSNNFIITVRNDSIPSNQYNTSKWKENASGITWTLQTISDMVSNYEGDNDTKIVLKQDYYDFRDFAYYGSLTELFRASVTDIIARFPGELYVTDEHAYLTLRESIDFEKIESQVLLGGEDYYLVSNPFGIDVHSGARPENGEILKYFADNGFANYRMGVGNTRKEDCDIVEDITWEDITSWNVKYFNPCSSGCDCSDLVLSLCGCDCSDLVLSLCGCDNIVLTLAETVRTIIRNNAVEEDTSREGFRKLAEITLSGKNGGTYVIYAYLTNDSIIYLSKDSGLHIRPKEPFLEEFFNECDSFQRLLVNKDTNYKATFSVIRENENGYYREFVPFQFPIGAGYYNLDASDYGFNAYTKQMVEIGEFYDERFTDNLWRSMTHEAIKNFDWTYTREYVEGDEEEYVFGGQRIQKALRIFAREFDEIISYINNIRNINRITYDERSNIPDYFLTDVVENEGWNVKLVYPYELKEYYYDENNERVECDDTEWEEGGDSCNGQLNNIARGHRINRDFSQNATNKVKPYSKSMINDYPNGYFIVCDDCGSCGCKDMRLELDSSRTREIINESASEESNPCGYGSETDLNVISASCDSTYNDKCALSQRGSIKNRIKSYSDESEWSYQEVNNEFLKRVKLNSRYIWRHKGTIDGIEMVLGMFGMKSKRWVDSQPEWVKNCKYSDCAGNLIFDYDINEYTSFANRIEETWDVIHQDYRINWINSTKDIVYDNRFISNYNRYGANMSMLSYQGIPVSYREAYVSQEGDDAYLKYDDNYYLDENGNKIIKRYLYPKFDKNEELDGNPYFQMNGGWLSKTIASSSSDTKWNFQYDVDDNIVYNRYLEKGSVDDDGFINDNHPLFKETVRNIKRIDNIASLLSMPTIELYNGIICYVTNIEKDCAVIDNVIYPINRVWYNTEDETSDVVKQYISLIKSDGYIRVGNNKFFDDVIIVYDIDGTETPYTVEDKPDGYEVKAYIKEDGSFICKEDIYGNYSISNFQILSNVPSDGYSNYFILDDINYSDMLAEFNEEDGWTSGWRRISETDNEYLKLNTIINDYNGNNPHNGKMVYDNGHEYLTYFKRMFKNAIDEDLFDERCYDDYYVTLDNEIVNYGFSGLIETNEDILQYDDFLIPDTKIHYFGNYRTNGTNKVWIYGDDTSRITDGYDLIYDSVTSYTLSSTTEDGYIGKNPYNEITAKTDIIDGETVPRYPIIDDITNQIVNNKIFDITFRLHNAWFTKKGQEELKYIDDIVMNYVTQMIPSTAILRINYKRTDTIYDKDCCGCHNIILTEV